MMVDPLAAYLQDHLAGATMATTLLSRLCRHWRHTPAGSTLRAVLADVRADRRVLQALTREAGRSSNPARALLGWSGEQALRLRTSWPVTGSREFRLFESLELLALGVTGKRALWRALRVADAAPSRMLDLAALEQRAALQFDRLEELRLSFARGVLGRDVRHAATPPRRTLRRATPDRHPATSDAASRSGTVVHLRRAKAANRDRHRGR